MDDPGNAEEQASGAAEQRGRSDSLEAQLKARSYTVLLSRLATMLMLTLFVGAATLLTFFFTKAASVETIDILGGSLRRDLLGRTADQLRTLLNEQARCSRQLSDAVWRAWDFNETLTGPAPPSLEFHQTLAGPAPPSVSVQFVLFSSLLSVSNAVRCAWDLNEPLTGPALLSVTDETIDYFLHYADVISAAGFCTPDGVTSNAYNRLAIPGLPPPSDAILTLLYSNQTVPADVSPPVYGRAVDRTTRATVRVPLRLNFMKVDCRKSAYYVLGTKSPTGKVIGILPGVGDPAPNVMQMNQIGFSPGGSPQVSRGIAGCVVSLKKVGEYLAELELEGGIIFVTNGTVLLASSVGYTGQNLSSTGNELLLPAQSSHPVIRATDKFLRAQEGVGVDMDADVTLLGVRSFVTKRDVSFEGFNMTVVLVLPRKAIMSRIDAKARVTIMTIAVSAAGIGVVGCFLVVLLTKPVSEEIRLKHELIRQLEAKKRAEERNETKSRFLANMSHELRSPLASILGLLDLLLDDGLTPPQHNSALQMRECAAGLLGLLNDILDFSKIEAGKVSLEAMEFDAVSLMENLIEMMSVHSARKGIELVLDAPEDIGPVLYGDPSRFRQVFTNLLNNAIKFTKEGFVILRCRTADEKGWLVFDVEDSGCGIPPERAASVFEAFVQADPSTTRLYGGTGLGLTIVKSLVHLMGGTVTIEPKPSPGTIFRVRLPMRKSSREHSPGAATEHFPRARPPGIPPIIKQLVMPNLENVKPPPDPGDQEAPRSSGGLLSPTRAEQPAWLQRLKTIRKAHSETARARSLSSTKLEDRRRTFPGAAANGNPHALVRASSNLIAGLGETSAPRARRRALLAMGGAMGRAVAARFLGGQGLEVVCAADWGAALERVSRARARVVRENGDGDPLLVSPGFVDGGSISGDENRTASRNGTTPGFDLVFLDVGLLTVEATDPDAFGQRLRAVRESLDGSSNNQRSKMTAVLQSEQGGKAATSPGLRWPGSGTAGSGSTGSGTTRSGRTGQFAGPHVVWLVGNEVPAAARRLLHEEGFGRVLQKPVFVSRLRALLTELSAARQEESGDPPRSQSSARKPNGIAIENGERASLPHIPECPECEKAAEDQSVTPPSLVALPPGALAPVANSPGTQEAINEQFKRAGYRALVAEDSPVLRQLAQRVLEKMGARVVTVENGRQAVEAVLAANLGGMPAESGEGRTEEGRSVEDGTAQGRAEAEPFDFVLMDCQMPVMDGYAASRLIRAAERARAPEGAPARPRLLILALTAHAMSEDEARCLEAGMDLYLTKPLQVAKLADVIVDHMGRRK
ncbi:Signal transduction histidine kinase [Klebsormidium nitens]|uniref:Signal transduction histidine kinase n=1 Tax=Klebsormidium nitens TaxID=105231 RepID=A0A1Y1I6X6_KLENI|nr:Signal transduction histidine kinase [Klebsormidium nitens]|eukprot:GAQ86704.1 Signal transduction histidine kinase [Klebsormidium nitens]